jgi:hypothetical protein
MKAGKVTTNKDDLSLPTNYQGRWAMSYASTMQVGKRFKPCIMIEHRCYVLDRAYSDEGKAMAAAITVYGLLKEEIEQFLRKRRFEEK